MRLIGPFEQIVTLAGLPIKGAIKDQELQVIDKGGIIVEDGIIVEVGEFRALGVNAREIEPVPKGMVLIPGLVDSHTHICYGGSRAGDYALKVSGATYQNILAAGGGIHDSVGKTRKTKQEDLETSMQSRVKRHLSEGVTTIEVKSGYGLSVDSEIKMLEAIKNVGESSPVDIIPTCLAAHVVPGEYTNALAYSKMIINELFPLLQQKKLANRIDVFVEENAFSMEVSREYLSAARAMGFDLTIHADQFSIGGTDLAVELGALSADHLEASTDREIELLAKSDVVGTVLPGASLGLGMHYAPARKLLDAGVCMAIATDWNPGSAPMGDLLLQASIMGASEKVSIAETLAGITFRAAKALNLNDRGKLEAGKLADFIAFDTSDYREIFYNQGKLKPSMIWKDGQLLKD